jgi:hypothetical protein
MSDPKLRFDSIQIGELVKILNFVLEKGMSGLHIKEYVIWDNDQFASVPDLGFKGCRQDPEQITNAATITVDEVYFQCAKLVIGNWEGDVYTQFRLDSSGKFELVEASGENVEPIDADSEGSDKEWNYAEIGDLFAKAGTHTAEMMVRLLHFQCANHNSATNLAEHA